MDMLTALNVTACVVVMSSQNILEQGHQSPPICAEFPRSIKNMNDIVDAWIKNLHRSRMMKILAPSKDKGK